MSTSIPASVNGFERAEHLLALHGEQADFRFERKTVFLAAARHLLVVPDHVFQRERDLLPGLVRARCREFFSTPPAAT